MDDTTRQFKALANRHRLAIFQYLRGRGQVTIDGPDEGCTVGTIAGQFDLALSTVSHHLRVLHEAGLIRCEQRGQFTCCVVDWDAVARLRAFLGDDTLPAETGQPQGEKA